MAHMAGELYVIGEVDPVTGKDAPFVKIGIVRDSDTRNTTQRVSEHQTGNPRKLIVHGVVKSSMVERLETAMHDTLAPLRISGEWFNLDRKGVTWALEHAKALSRQVNRIDKHLETAELVKSTVSNGNVLASTSRERGLHRTLIEADVRIKAGERAEKAVRDALIAANDRKVDVAAHLIITPKIGTTSFDDELFKASHPRLWQRYQVETQLVRGRFTPSSAGKKELDLAVLDSDLAELVAEIEAMAEEFGRRGRKPKPLHTLFLTLVAAQAPIKWQRMLVEAELRAACGIADGITDVCTWTRKSVQQQKLDTAALKRDHPAKWEQFLVTKPGTTSYSVVKDNNYRL